MLRAVLIFAIAVCAGIVAAPFPVRAGAGGQPSNQGRAAPSAQGMYVLNLATGATLNVGPLPQTSSPLNESWSPDSKKIAIARAADATGGDGGLQVVDVTTGGVRTVVASNQGQALQFAWSPDGSQLAFILMSQIGDLGSGATSLQVWRASDNTMINLVPSGATVMAWTPDGSGITAAIVPPLRDANTSGGRIVTVDAKTGDVRATILTGPSVECQIAMAWSPDGSYLAYGGTGFHQGCGSGTAGNGLWSWQASTGTTRHLLDGTSSIPLWMEDGTVLAEVATLGGSTGLQPISLTSFQPDGSGQRVLASPIPNMFPPPSPAYQTSSGEVMYVIAQCDGSAAWVVDPGSSQPRNLTSPTMYAFGPHLSADGRTVAFSGQGSQGGYLALAPVDGGRTTTPLIGAPPITPGDFSPDGAWLAFSILPDWPVLCLP